MAFKGHIPWNKGKKTGLTPKSAFQKGHIPFNKGKKHLFLSNHPNWKGGRTIIRGYFYIKKEGYYNANINGYVREHRYVMEQYLKRRLNKKEVIHHINGDKLDNRIENLELLKNQTEHLKKHLRLRNKGKFI